MSRLHSRLLSSSLPGASQMIIPLLSTHPAHVQSRYLLLKSLLAVRAHGHEDDGSLLIACGTGVAIDASKQIGLCLLARVELAQTPLLVLLAAFPRP
jgi:hypothetical protein